MTQQAKLHQYPFPGLQQFLLMGLFAAEVVVAAALLSQALKAHVQKIVQMDYLIVGKFPLVSQTKEEFLNLSLVNVRIRMRSGKKKKRK